MSLPSPFDLIGGTLRLVLGASERAEADVARAVPLHEPHELEAKLEEAVAAAHRAAEALERHVAVLGTLSESLPALTTSVTSLTEQLGHLMKVTAPLAVAEREASRLDRLLRRRGEGASAASAPAVQAPAAADDEQQPPD